MSRKKMFFEEINEWIDFYDNLQVSIFKNKEIR